jgi:hypothetical protein
MPVNDARQRKLFFVIGSVFTFIILLHSSSVSSSAAVMERAKTSRLSKLPPNTALSLGNYQPAPLAGCSVSATSITDYSRLTYDDINHQILMFGGGHAATPRTDVDVFNPIDLKWSSAYPSTPAAEMSVANFNKSTGGWNTTGHPMARHTYDLMPFASNTKELILLKQTDFQPRCQEMSQWQQHPGKIWHYNPATKTWRPSAAAPVWGLQDVAAAAEFHPPSGKIIVLSRYGMYTYDPLSEVAIKHLNFTRAELGYAQNLVYFPPTDRMYYIKNDGRVFEVSLDPSDFAKSTITEVVLTGTRPNTTETGWAYDSMNQIIGGGITDGVFYAFDPLRKLWSSHKTQVSPTGADVGSQVFHCIDYDPVNGVFIFISKAASRFTTWAYKYGSGTATTGTR